MSRTTLFGPPGTGKTTTLSRWAKQAAEKYGGENIMICSLTRTAAAEIASRDTGVPKENVGTLHAHAYRCIEDVKVMGKDQINEWNEENPGWRIPNAQATDDEISGGSGGGAALSRYDLFRAKCIPREAMPAGIQSFAEAYEIFKQSRGVIDFTDMIQYAIDHIDCPMKYIIMDEAQDCSALEFKLLTKWAGQADATIIAGDDDQAAYEWRGASVDAFLGFSENHKVLDQSYRLPLNIQRKADRWVSKLTKRKEKVYAPKPGNPGVAVKLEYRKGEDVVRHALSQSGTSMILATCGYMTGPYVNALKSLAEPFFNPFRVRGDFASTWNPLQQGGTSTATITDSVVAFLSPPWTERQAWMWLRELSDLPRGSKKALESKKSSDELMPLERLGTMLGETGLMAALDGDLEWFLTRCKEDKKRREAMRYRIRVAQRFGVDGLTAKPSIIVGTIHSVKGGQADNVYLLPDLSAKGKEAWSLGSNHDPIIRQMYIGMTRASQRLFLLKEQKHAVLRWE